MIIPTALTVARILDSNARAPPDTQSSVCGCGAYREQLPRLKEERDHARGEAARLAVSRDDLAHQQARWKAAVSRVPPLRPFPPLLVLEQAIMSIACPLSACSDL